MLPVMMLAAWIGLFAAPAAAQANSKVRDCAAVSTGRAEPVLFAAPLESFGDVQVQGVLRKPVGDRKFAALVVLHGAGGIRPPRCHGGAIDRFTSWGYVTLLVDSTSQSDRSGVQASDYSFLDQAYHANGAAAFLAALPYVDADRIGVVGWSKGGLATIIAIASPELQGPGGSRIGAAAAIYPLCPWNSRRLFAPLLVLIGENDAVVSVAACRHLKEAVLTDTMRLVIYPDADHLFDAPWSPAYRRAAGKDAFERLRRHFETNLNAE